MILLSTRNLSMSYGPAHSPVLKDINLNISPGEIVSLIGPSGCGKSTLLSLLSGILQPTAGKAVYREAEIAGPSRKRVIIFQNHALFPWLTARQNVEFAMDDNSPQDTDFFLRQVGLQNVGAHYPHQLSGGMQQRVGIARALAADPEVLLLDEPFASLDIINREILSQELLALTKQLNKTMVLVTHNIDEALYLSDRIYLLSGRPGQIQQEISVHLSKPPRLLEFRQTPGYLELERKIHEHLYRTHI